MHIYAYIYILLKNKQNKKNQGPRIQIQIFSHAKPVYLQLHQILPGTACAVSLDISNCLCIVAITIHILLSKSYILQQYMYYVR